MTHDDDHEIEKLVRAAQGRFVARADATFDFDAGLADIYRRAGLELAPRPASRPQGPGPRSAAAAREHIDDLIMSLESITLPAREPDVATRHLQRATEILADLRRNLARGSVGGLQAQVALGRAGHVLDQADAALRAERGLSLDDALHHGGRDSGELGLDTPSRLGMLGHEIDVAFGESRPEPVRRQAPAPPRTSRADGA